MGIGSGARKVIVWGGGALAGVGLLVASFFAGTAVAENPEFEQVGSTAQEQDAGDNESRDFFDEQDTQDKQDEQDEQDTRDEERRDADGEAEQGPDGQGPEQKDPDAEEGEGRYDDHGRHHGRHHDGGHHDGGPDADAENQSGDGSAPA
ncbi:hypothetical protein [Arthrobacter sp. zg-Y1171]|uniref:hypothetical protein n=1 Tax=Arthrobacter sp. zg-Y1171 TaxID=2964610 RepID=UPI0021020FDB|nr:hypothetical protein [Arthrobacter sp. zg-Y1171]MCQ1994073.1 hypothetical protein [Arthrobacter sp. zg-Y1171]UWX81820.1 hypothetical protein N2L00_15785 [Arthrobacter sp. zg-Y1171]